MPSKSDSDSVITQNTRQIMQDIHQRPKTRTPEDELGGQIVQKLAGRAYHLPEYNVCRDWLQYITNNHPVLGICCHHRLHPLRMRQRLIILLGSFVSGIAITNAIYLWFLSSGRDDKEQVFAINVSSQESVSQKFYVTSGFLVLVTVGSGTHALFDRFVWSLSACGCCRTGGRFESRSCCNSLCKSLGYYLVVFLILTMIALATLIVAIRSSVEEGESISVIPLIQNQTKDSIEESLQQILDNEVDFSFLKAYAVEFVVSLFFYGPLLETILFSGVLGCFCIPILGGRPAAMKREAKALAEERRCPSHMA